MSNKKKRWISPMVQKVDTKIYSAQYMCGKQDVVKCCTTEYMIDSDSYFS